MSKLVLVVPVTFCLLCLLLFLLLLLFLQFESRKTHSSTECSRLVDDQDNQLLYSSILFPPDNLKLLDGCEEQYDTHSDPSY